MHFEIPGSDSVVVYDHEGKTKAENGNRVPMVGKYKAHSMHARTLHAGQKLLIEGSPFASRYGQNVYTSRQCLRGCRIAIKRVIKIFAIDAPEHLVEKWMSGDIDIERIDLAVNFRLGSEAEVLDVLKQVKRQLIEQHGPTRTNGTSVWWEPQNGTRYSIMFYAKGQQIRHTMSARKNKLPQREMLLKECENILRIEVRLRRSELKLLGLDKASAWGKDTAEMLFESYFSKLKLLKITSGMVSADERRDLPPAMLKALAIHKAGMDLSDFYSEATCRKQRNYFRKLGVDLRVPNQTEGSITSLGEYLSSEKVIAEPPEWMNDEGIVPKKSPTVPIAKDREVTKLLKKNRRF